MTSICPLCRIGSAGSAKPLFEKNGYRLLKCSRCSLVWVSNPPSARDLAKLYSFESGYHRQTALAASCNTIDQRAASEYRFISGLRHPARLLDIGCSVGSFLRQAQLHGWKTTGIELSPDTARIGRERYGLDIRVGTVEEQRIPDESFEIVTLWDVIEHMTDPFAALAMIRPWLTRDGLLILETPNIRGLFPHISYIVARRLDYWPHPEPPGHLFQFSKATITKALECAGFRLVSIADRRIPLSYSFGSWRTLAFSHKRLAYAIAFGPLAIIGPWLHCGDTIRVIASRAR